MNQMPAMTTASPVAGDGRRTITAFGALVLAVARWSVGAAIDALVIMRDKLGSMEAREETEANANRSHGVRPPSRTPFRRQSGSRAGRVTLVGAGPGDPELLTLKAIRHLNTADAILYDDLVSDEILAFARPGSQLINVGKRCGRAACRQSEINALLAGLAKSGKHVVRLKSGDPSLFGRAGEELQWLAAAGVGVDMVPGITAATAMAAALGVSLTHRDVAKSVRFITGHSKMGGLPEDIDWHAVADRSATTIFYMGNRTAAAIADRLIGAGVAPATPVAIAASLGRARQQLRHTNLAALASALADFSPADPIVIGVGDVFASPSASAQAAAFSGQAHGFDATFPQ